MSISIEGEARKPSLLIIDDQPENIRLLVRILNQAGYLDITTATDPGRVSELHALCRPDIVLLDLHMPTHDGFAVLEKLAPFTFGVDRLPVIMVTADDSSETKRKALSLGAKDFISKPFDQAEVVLRIQNLLETRFLHQQLRRHNNELEKKVAERTRELEQSQIEMLERLATAVEFQGRRYGRSHEEGRIGVGPPGGGDRTGGGRRRADKTRGPFARHREGGDRGRDSAQAGPPDCRRAGNHANSHDDRFKDAFEGPLRAGEALSEDCAQPS